MAIRFGALYFVLQSMGGDLFIGEVAEWSARHIWGIVEPLSREETGSGDRLYDFMGHFAALLVAALATLIWSLIDRKRTQDRWLYEGLRVLLRYGLASALIGYGFAKTSQFPALNYVEMARPLGSQTSMGVLWNFMGVSEPYTLFSGVMEISAGLLLLFRRTTTLGALLGMVVMTNVFLLNLTYDVPVKLGSFHLLVSALVLLLPDVKRLLDVLILNRSTQPRELTPPIRYPKLRLAVLAAKWIFFGNMLWNGAMSSWWAWEGLHRPSTPYDGIWNVTSFREDGGELATVSLANPARWQRLAVNRRQYGKFFSLEYVGGKRIFGNAVVQDGGMRLSSKGESHTWQAHFEGGNRMILSGMDGNKTVQITLQRADIKEFPLAYRSFHFVQERPRTP